MVPALLNPVADVRRLEVVKWLAFLAMVADHVDLLWFGRSVPWLHQVGLFAFPVFALSFGLGLARSSAPLGVAWRLLVAGGVAQLVWFWLDPGHYANVLLVFAACAAVAFVSARSAPLALGLGALVLWLCSRGGEGGLLGAVLVLAGWIAGRGVLTAGEARALFLAVGAWWLLLRPSWAAVLAFALVMFLPLIGTGVRRWRGALLWLYPAHLLAFL